jgi:hypothetical protein
MQSITNAKSTAAAGGNNITGTNFTACRSTPSGSSNTESCTTSFSPTNGRTLIVHVYVDMSSAGSPTISCTDGEGTGNTYVNDGSDTPNNSFNNAILRLQSASGSGAYTITCQLSAAGTGFIGIFVRNTQVSQQVRWNLDRQETTRPARTQRPTTSQLRMLMM